MSKEEITELTTELKELKQFKKDTFKYWKLIYNQINGKKLTKQQDEFMKEYAQTINEYLVEENKK